MAMNRGALVFLARLSEQAERYDEMLVHVKSIATTFDDELSVEERNLLAVAYKNVIGSRRAAWRVVSAIENRSPSDEHADHIKTYRESIAAEIVGICGDYLALIDKRLLPFAESEESRIFHYKTQGDYYRYLAEVQVGKDREATAKLAMDAYVASTSLAVAEMSPTHPIRLGLALNFSVFYYETMEAPTRACALAKRAFDDAIAELDTLSDENYRDSTLVMQLLRDNLTLWASEESDDADSSKGQ